MKLRREFKTKVHPHSGCQLTFIRVQIIHRQPPRINPVSARNVEWRSEQPAARMEKRATSCRNFSECREGRGVCPFLRSEVRRHQVPAMAFRRNQSTGKYIVEVAQHHTKRPGDGSLQRGLGGLLLRPLFLPPTLRLQLSFSEGMKTNSNTPPGQAAPCFQLHLPQGL